MARAAGASVSREDERPGRAGEATRWPAPNDEEGWRHWSTPGPEVILTLVGMAMVQLPDELARRLEAEAARRGQSVHVVAAELVAAGLGADNALESFIGSGRSGSTEPIDVRSLRAEVADRRLADGA
jgi:plasmid stability protein